MGGGRRAVLHLNPSECQKYIFRFEGAEKADGPPLMRAGRETEGETQEFWCVSGLHAQRVQRRINEAQRPFPGFLLLRSFNLKVNDASWD